MSETYGPDTYVIQLNASETPSLYTFDGTPTAGDPQFQAAGNASFFFQVFDSRITFAEEPITWWDPTGSRMPEPGGNGHSVAKDVKVLTLNVTPLPASEVIPTYHFKLHVMVDDRPEVLWTSDGSRVVDPTIIEKPPE